MFLFEALKQQHAKYILLIWDFLYDDFYTSVPKIFFVFHFKLNTKYKWHNLLRLILSNLPFNTCLISYFKRKIHFKRNFIKYLKKNIWFYKFKVLPSLSFVNCFKYKFIHYFIICLVTVCSLETDRMPWHVLRSFCVLWTFLSVGKAIFVIFKIRKL